MKKILLVGFFLALALSSSAVYAYYGEEDGGNNEDVRDYERLRLLQQATGGGNEPSGGSYFETRVSAMFDPATQATSVFDSQSREDALFNRETQNQERQNALQDQKNNARNRKAELGALPKNDNGLAGTNLAGELQMQPNTDQFKDRTSYIDASEENFQTLAQKKFQEDSEKTLGPEGSFTPQKKKIKKQTDPKPTLADNPYYFAGNTAQTRAGDFELSKPLILSRMIQNAIPAVEAENILVRSSTQEEVIMVLMDEYGKSYGNAKEITETAKRKS